MKIAVLGTGMVGRVIASKLVSLGHEVMMGSRTTDNPTAIEWVQKAGKNASHGDFATAAKFGEVVFNCTAGSASLQALEMAGKENLSNKTIVDLSNPLDFSSGKPRLFVCNTDSLAEQIQNAFPLSKVVKTLNTLSVMLMVDPNSVPGTEVFVSGNDVSAKSQVISILNSFGWKEPIDLGDITTARGAEAIFLMWINLYGKFGNADFNWKIVRK